MKRFEFKNKARPIPQIELDIAGHPFKLSATLDLFKKLERWGKRMVQEGKDLPETAEGVAAAWETMSAALDDILGDSATEQIFAGRAPSIEDACDVMSYISESLQEAAAEQAKPVIKPVSVPAKPDMQAALRILQNPDVMQAIQKAMDQ